MSLRSFLSLTSLSAAVARELAYLAKVAIASRGRFCVALSGGETPRTLYALLARDYVTAIDWQHVHLFWGDERFVPPDDPASNFRMAKETLIDRIPIPLENIHPILTSSANPQDAANAYAAIVKAAMPLDLVLLGLGLDGHTASLFPGTDLERAAGQVTIVTSSPVPPAVRISLTLNVLNAASNVFFLVSGKEKKEILKAVLAEEGNPRSKYPAAHVSPRGELVWFVEEAAMNGDAE